MKNVFREFVFIVFDRKRLILSVFLTVSVLFAVIAFVLPSYYRSSSKFSLIVPQNLDPLQQETSYDYRNRVRRFLQDQKETVLSNRVLLKVVQDLYPGASDSETSKILENLRKYVSVTPPTGETFEGSNVFILEFTDSDPERATQVARMITDRYLDAYREMSKSKTDYSQSFFQEEVQKLSREMSSKQEKLREFEIRKADALLEILNLEPGKSSNQEVGPSALLSQAIRNQNELKTELAGVTTLIQQIEKELSKKGIPVVLPEMEVYGRSISVFKTKVAQLQIQLNEMKTQFKDDFEPLKQTEQELVASIASLRNELERTLAAQKINAQSLEAKIRQSEQIVRNLREQIQLSAQEKATYQTLQQEYELARDAYTRAMNQFDQARMAGSLQQEKQYLTLIDSPAVPVKPYKPNRYLILMGGILSGLFLGIAAALTSDHFDHRLKTAHDISSHLKIPVLGSVSHV
jgi:uncharacterized protein involved in exopolysaccharide biosynthesis